MRPLETWFKNKDLKERTFDTLFGEVTIERRYYKDSNDEFRFLLDEYLNIPANERQSPALKEIEHLFVEADGIHISLQKDDNEKGELKQTIIIKKYL